MAPNFASDVVEPVATEPRFEKLVAPQAAPRKHKILYLNIGYFAYWHLAGLYGLYLCLTSAKWPTIVQAYFLYLLGNMGITAGAHRLWSHRSYKAKLPLQIILMVCNTIAFQNTVFTWARDHRLHHKYSDTDADPHNAARGFFFSHIGWLMVKRNPEVIKRGKQLDMSDIYNNPVLRFQKKYAVPFITTVCFILPTVIPMYFWNESFNVAWHMTLLRYTINLNTTFLVNSAAHFWGYKTYDKNIMATQNYLATMATFGEGFHNYHHVFPWDYRAAELGNNYLNLTTKFIDFFAWIGWAYDLKTVPEDLVKKRMERTGDGTNLWGWGDKDMKEYVAAGTEILYPNDEPRSVRVRLKEITDAEIKLGTLKHYVLIFELIDKWKLQYQAFCAGSIITKNRVLTSANCFLTNRKRYKKNLSKVRVVAGIIHTLAKQPVHSDTQQWRTIVHIYSQKFFRFPAFDLAILEVNAQYVFNQFVDKINYATLNQDYDGVCMSTVVRPVTSWSSNKYVYMEEMKMIPRRKCERRLLRSCYIFYCTSNDPYLWRADPEIQGGGLVCFDTGDPAETDKSQGLLVGVTSLVNAGLPDLHTRIGVFHKWVTDDCARFTPHNAIHIVWLCIVCATRII